MNRVRKLSRQISVVALALISVTALLLATGLLVYVDDNGGLPSVIVRDGDVPLADPGGDEMPEEPDGQGVNWGDSTTVVVTGMIIVVIFVFVWFLVFRPRPEGEETPKAASGEPPVEPPVYL
ncbi:MAG: hypothetical protein LBK75_08840 [Oscillospiraceae bacterium]|jgi:heme/copper-type cytochrome/quinol oxidase subunit 2|nr:hypothetical protein [Oscillospiraceae bacterium]